MPYTCTNGGHAANNLTYESCGNRKDILFLFFVFVFRYKITIQVSKATVNPKAGYRLFFSFIKCVFVVSLTVSCY